MFVFVGCETSVGKDLKDFEQICWISRRRRLKKWSAPLGQKSHKSFQIKQIKKTGISLLFLTKTNLQNHTNSSFNSRKRLNESHEYSISIKDTRLRKFATTSGGVLAGRTIAGACSRFFLVSSFYPHRKKIIPEYQLNIQLGEVE